MKTNYLVGLVKQLQYAMDEGLQEAYEFAVLVDECLDMVSPQGDVDGTDDDEAGAGPEYPGQLEGARRERSEQGLQGHVRDAVRSDDGVAPPSGVQGTLPHVAARSELGVRPLDGAVPGPREVDARCVRRPR